MSIEQITTRGRNLALIAALLGWMFDGMEMGLFPLVGKKALQTMLQGDAAQSVNSWFAAITAVFLVGAATGGVLFGWLGDKIGRVRAMTISVFVYTSCSCLCGFAQAPEHLAILRFLGALGMGGEWALGVSLVMELWPNASRGMLAGLIGAFGNLGYAIVGGISLLLNRISSEIDLGSMTSAGNWRLLMFAGAAPAVLTLFIRFFVPESQKWEKEKLSGHSKNWASVDLIAVLIGSGFALGIVYVWLNETTISLGVRVICTVIGLLLTIVCYLYPVWGYLSRSKVTVSERNGTLRQMLLAAGLSGVPLLATWGGVMWVYNWVDKLTMVNGVSTNPDARPITQIASAVGAAIGCYLAAMLCGRLGRRPVYALLCVVSAISLYGFYTLNTQFNSVFVITAGLVGLITAAFYGWLPLYLPELFHTSVRATGQGFGYNFGRILASIGTLQTGALLNYFDNNYAKACSLAAMFYVLGFFLIWFAPETKGKPLPE